MRETVEQGEWRYSEDKKTIYQCIFAQHQNSNGQKESVAIYDLIQFVPEISPQCAAVKIHSLAINTLPQSPPFVWTVIVCVCADIYVWEQEWEQ